jgi:hypothetical protein
VTRASDDREHRRPRGATPSKRTPKARHRVRSSKSEPAAAPLPGVASKLNPLDLDRAASMADEGGRAAATVERESAVAPPPLAPSRRSRTRGRTASASLALFGLLVVVIAALRWRR